MRNFPADFTTSFDWIYMCVCPGGVLHSYVPLCRSDHLVYPWHHPGRSHQRHQVLPDPTVAEGPWCKGIHSHKQADGKREMYVFLLLAISDCVLVWCRCGETQRRRSSTPWAVPGGVSSPWLPITSFITTVSGWYSRQGIHNLQDHFFVTHAYLLSCCLKKRSESGIYAMNKYLEPGDSLLSLA